MTPAQELTAALGGRWTGSGGTSKCPAHDDHAPSLSIRDGDRDVLLTCHAGCDRLAIWRELVNLHLVGQQRHDAPRPVPRPRDDSGRRDAALRLWREAQPATGSVVETYLCSRGVTLPVPPTLRHHGSARYAPTGLYLDCMIGAVQGAARRVIAVHRTYLTAAGRKAPVSSPKMALAPLAYGAVRLAAAGEVLGIAEGIETGLSAQQLHRVPVWCSLGCERLGKIELPPEVRRVVLFGDRGAEAQVDRARAAYEGQGLAVEIRYPPPPAKDWNDHLVARSAAA